MEKGKAVPPPAAANAAGRQKLYKNEGKDQEVTVYFFKEIKILGLKEIVLQ